MTNAELLQLDPRHLAELRSFYAGCEFDDVDIFAREITIDNYQDRTANFSYAMSKLVFDSVFCGEDHTHCVFHRNEDNVFYCVSHVQIGCVFEKIIFKLTRRE